MSVFSVLGSLTAKCGSKSMRSVSLKPEIFSALGRWSTTACSGTPLPRPLEPLPRALTAPRPRGWTPRPRPGDSSPRLAAWKKTIRAHQNTAGVEIMFHHLKFQEQVCPQVATVQAAFLYMVSSLPSFFFFLNSIPQFAAGYIWSSTGLCPLQPESSYTDPAVHPAVLSVPVSESRFNKNKCWPSTRILN